MNSEANASGSRSTMRSIDRAIDILQALERASSPIRLIDLSRLTGLHSSTAMRILSSLQDRGLVINEGSNYRLGLGALALAHGFLANDPISSRALPVMQMLSSRTGMTVSLYAKIDMERILLARVDGRTPLHYQIPIGRRFPLVVGAGKVIGANLNEQDTDLLVKTYASFERADGAQLDAEELRAEMSRVRKDGYAITLGERDPGVVAISAPVRRGDGELIGSLSASAPAESTGQDALNGVLPELLRATSSLQDIL